jgi:phenylalanyl-tRNA synthetase alpha chain
MRVFFRKMGIENLRFKPAYNPYTEVSSSVAFLGRTHAVSAGFFISVNNFFKQPSLEIFAFHPMLNRWVEVGNSGMFRPEMLEPMGFPKDVHVHGWGISLERPTMIRCVRSTWF